MVVIMPLNSMALSNTLIFARIKNMVTIRHTSTQSSRIQFNYELKRFMHRVAKLAFMISSANIPIKKTKQLFVYYGQSIHWQRKKYSATAIGI